MATWIRVTQREPCPICGKGDWCGVTDDSTAAHCMRVPSEKACKNGGWIHRLVEEQPGLIKRTVRRFKPKPTFPMQYWDDLLRRYQANWELGEAYLRISKHVWDRLMIGWSDEQYGATFPMFTGSGRICGIRIRTHTGKFCVPGSRQGLFWPLNLIGRGRLVIAEGPTDCATLLEAGFNAIGRPSCVGGVTHIKRFLRDHDYHDVVIMADNDPWKKRPDGSLWRPGWEGATALASEISGLVNSVRVVKPAMAKDVRQWRQNGATRTDIWKLIER